MQKLRIFSHIYSHIIKINKTSHKRDLPQIVHLPLQCENDQSSLLQLIVWCMKPLVSSYPSWQVMLYSSLLVPGTGTAGWALSRLGGQVTLETAAHDGWIKKKIQIESGSKIFHVIDDGHSYFNGIIETGHEWSVITKAPSPKPFLVCCSAIRGHYSISANYFCKLVLLYYVHWSLDIS